MRSVDFFVEDTGHEKFLIPLVQIFAMQYGIQIKITINNSTGGHGKVITTLKQYIRDIDRGRKISPDLLIVAIDGNNEGYSARKKEIDNAAKTFAGQLSVLYLSHILNDGYCSTRLHSNKCWEKAVLLLHNRRAIMHFINVFLKKL